MRIKYKQRYGVTMVSLFDYTMIGLTSIRPGDKFDRRLGMAIALIKAHTKLNKREQKLAYSLFDLPWKAIQIPQESIGKIMITALQFRQAIGQSKMLFRNEDEWYGEKQVIYDENDWTGNSPSPRVLVSQSGKPVCEVAEAFGRRLLKMSAL